MPRCSDATWRSRVASKQACHRPDSFPETRTHRSNPASQRTDPHSTPNTPSRSSQCVYGGTPGTRRAELFGSHRARRCHRYEQKVNKPINIKVRESAPLTHPIPAPVPETHAPCSLASSIFIGLPRTGVAQLPDKSGSGLHHWLSPARFPHNPRGLWGPVSLFFFIVTSDSRHFFFSFRSVLKGREVFLL